MVAHTTAWVPLDGIEAREKRDHVPYRDWIRAGFMRGCPGDTMDYEDVTQVIEQAAIDYDLRTVGFDPYLSRTITQRLSVTLEPYGTALIEVPQTIAQLSPAMKEMDALIRKHEMLHVHNTAARWCFGNIRCAEDGNGNLKPMKNKSTGRIDITVGWIISAVVALLQHKVTLADAVARDDYHM